MDSRNILKFEDVSIGYGDKTVCGDIEFSLDEGETLALVGESGCGKSTVLKAILGIKGGKLNVKGGRILLNGKDMSEMNPKDNQDLRGTEIGMIFQDPATSFNPIRTYRKQFQEMLKSHDKYDQKKSYEEIDSLFKKVMLQGTDRILDSCPYELSGGMNQRVAIAASLLLDPDVLLLDEPTSALDVTTQKNVVEELVRLKEIRKMTMLLVTHNLGVAAHVADKMAVMYAGRIVEYGDTRAILDEPKHPYTKSLIAAIPVLGEGMPVGIDGQPPLFGPEMEGCAFYERCPYAKDKCKTEEYHLKQVGERHFTDCEALING
ncbi:MAG: ABC transporter ATP-binding protein [Firmicutes bacterium]|nr:ABC transporter ATP-binding protein [Bacillota bacterium]